MWEKNKDTENRSLWLFFSSYLYCLANFIVELRRAVLLWRYRSLPWLAWTSLYLSMVNIHAMKSCRTIHDTQRVHLKSPSLECATGALNPQGSEPTPTHTQKYIYSECHTCKHAIYEQLLLNKSLCKWTTVTVLRSWTQKWSFKHVVKHHSRLNGPVTPKSLFMTCILKYVKGLCVSWGALRSKTFFRWSSTVSLLHD